MPGEMQITAIRPTQRDVNRATVRVGSPGRAGKVVATLNQSAVQALGLKVGMPWDEALAERVAEAKTSDKAFRDASNRLARRAMSRGMLDEKLRGLGHDEAVRAEALERLEKLGLLDDEGFGRALIREATRSRPAGPRLLRQKLFQKRLNAKLIDRLIAEHEAAQQARDDPDAEAVEFAVKRAATLRRFDAATRRRRLYGQLARRGFNSDTIERAMNAALREVDDGSDA